MVWFTFFVIYFLPTGIAAIRNVDSIYEITYLNILGGWTIIGWFMAINAALND